MICTQYLHSKINKIKISHENDIMQLLGTLYHVFFAPLPKWERVIGTMDNSSPFFSTTLTSNPYKYKHACIGNRSRRSSQNSRKCTFRVLYLPSHFVEGCADNHCHHTEAPLKFGKIAFIKATSRLVLACDDFYTYTMILP